MRNTITALVIFALAPLLVLSPAQAQDAYVSAFCERVADIAETAASSYYEDFSVTGYYQSMEHCSSDIPNLPGLVQWCEALHGYAWRLPRHTSVSDQEHEVARWKDGVYLICLRDGGNVPNSLY